MCWGGTHVLDELTVWQALIVMFRDTGGRRPERVKEDRGEVQSRVHPQMKWVIEWGINSANNLGSPLPFQTGVKKNIENGVSRDGEREMSEAERKSHPPSGGKGCY